jgi:cold shock CspA family protein
MAKSQITFNKKEREKKRLKKRLDKQQKKEERKSNAPGGGLDSMLAYVDENGNITDTPPDATKKHKIDIDSIETGVPKREAAEAGAPRSGRVAFFNDSKGFGFIKELDSQKEYFVHIRGCVDQIGENDHVTFDLERSMKGMNAVNVRKVKP